MTPVKFSWVGSKDLPNGQALYSRDGTTFLELEMPCFKTANAVYLALNTTLNAGYYDGISKAQQVMNTALKDIK